MKQKWVDVTGLIIICVMCLCSVTLMLAGTAWLIGRLL